MRDFASDLIILRCSKGGIRFKSGVRHTFWRMRVLIRPVTSYIRPACRRIPPLVITKDEIDWALERIEAVLTKS